MEKKQISCAEEFQIIYTFFKKVKHSFSLIRYGLHMMTPFQEYSMYRKQKTVTLLWRILVNATSASDQGPHQQW